MYLSLDLFGTHHAMLTLVVGVLQRGDDMATVKAPKLDTILWSLHGPICTAACDGLPVDGAWELEYLLKGDYFC